jgi:DNA-directed RNA polymerase specialized sigma24 family protein
MGWHARMAVLRVQAARRRWRAGLRQARPGGDAADVHLAAGRHRGPVAVGVAARSGRARRRTARSESGRQQPDEGVRAAYEAHHRGLTQLAVLLAGDLAAAEEIVQAAFVSMHRARPRLATGGGLRHLRREVVQRARSRRPGSSQAAPQSRLPGGPPAAPILAILQTIPVRQREAVVLRYFAGLSDTEIAAVTGARPAAISRYAQCGLAAFALAARVAGGPAARQPDAVTRPAARAEPGHETAGSRPVGEP